MANKYAIMRIEKIKSVSSAGARLRHIRRVVPCPTATPGVRNIRVVMNEQMKENKNRPFKEIFKERVGDQKIRKNAVISVEVVLTFSPDGVSPDKYKEWVKENAEWLKTTFGEKNIVECIAHKDEKTFHIHCQMILCDEKGKLNTRRFVGGHRDRMSELQTSYARQMEKFGLERGVNRKITKKKHESSLRWHAMQAEKEERLKQYERTYGRNLLKEDR